MPAMPILIQLKMHQGRRAKNPAGRSLREPSHRISISMTTGPDACSCSRRGKLAKPEKWPFEEQMKKALISEGLWVLVQAAGFGPMIFDDTFHKPGSAGKPSQPLVNFITHDCMLIGMMFMTDTTKLPGNDQSIRHFRSGKDCRISGSAFLTQRCFGKKRNSRQCGRRRHISHNNQLCRTGGHSHAAADHLRQSFAAEVSLQYAFI
jgi:hypothetical protein